MINTFPLLGSLAENVDLWFRNIEGDIVVDFYLRNQISAASLDGVINVESLGAVPRRVGHPTLALVSTTWYRSVPE